MSQPTQKRKEEEKKDFVVVEAQPANESSPQPPTVRATTPTPQAAIPISFDRWWIQTQNKYNFRPALKKAVRKHFEARGFMDYRKFDAGLRDFGFNT